MIHAALMCEVSHVLHTLQALLGMQTSLSLHILSYYPIGEIAALEKQVWDKQTHLQLHPAHQG